MTPMAFDLGGSEVIIVIIIALVLFGGSRLAGLGKSAGRAIREFKEETAGLAGSGSAPTSESSARTADAAADPDGPASTAG